MSLTRHNNSAAEPDGSVWVRSMAVGFTTPYASGALRHEWAKLSYAAEGVLRVETPDGAWIAPPHRAVWIPAGVAHREETRGRAAMRSLYFATAACAALPRACVALNVPPLLRELILEVAAVHSVLDAAKPEQERLARVIVDRLALLPPATAQALPLPRDKRALTIASALQDEPANDESLAALARRAGASARTAQRLFTEETGLAFAQWRQRLRLLTALERLGAGRSVTDTAFDVGYTSVSAFVSAFRREFGVTPGRFASA
jgi:AraC-like DNA-binding protein